MRKLLVIQSAIIAFGFTSCDNREDVEGQWQSETIDLKLPNTLTSSLKIVMTFSQDGRVTMNSDINLTEAISTPADPVKTAHVNVTATASIDGTWRYSKCENDEVDITFDDNSFALNIDDNAIRIEGEDITNDDEMSERGQYRQAAYANYRAMLANEMRAYFAQFAHLEDIEVKKGDNASLSFEIDRHDMPDLHFIFRPI